MRERIVVGMSGGVDSSVAAALLVEQGHDVVGVTLRVWPWVEPEKSDARFGSCCSPATVDDARQVARRLSIPFYLLNSEREFDETVVADFARQYAAGRTPVPCVVCNREVKFGSLLRRALAWDAVAVATGHYARITRDEATGRLLLWRGRDTTKDQSDFLWSLTQEQLAAARFPVGDLTKEAVRATARALGLVTADKPESQEICFIPDDDYRGFLRRRMPEAFRPGPIVDRHGEVLGEHDGLPNYTVGQRRGLGIAGPRARYVSRIDVARNALVVGPGEDVEATTVLAERVNLISIPALDGSLRVSAKIRHGHAPAPATIRAVDAGAGRGRLMGAAAEPRVEVRFDRPQRAASPGQSIVFYQDDLVVGGGVIAGPPERP